MLKEICIIPQVFDKTFLNEDTWKDLKSLLENIENSGYIVGLNNNDWKKTIREKINTRVILNNIDEKIVDKFNSILNVLHDRNRIVGHPKGMIKPTTENDWLKIAYELNDIRSFFAIITTKNTIENTISLYDLDDINISEKFGLTGTKHFIKTTKELEKVFLPLLAYAKKVTIIDPYFDISTHRYKETLILIAKSYRERRGKAEKGNIIINCSDKIFENYKITKWKKFIKQIYQDYGHLVIINIWDKKEDSIKLHDRYIITEQSGISSAAGTDKDDYQQSEWGIKDYSTLYDIENQYNENFSPFELKNIVKL